MDKKIKLVFDNQTVTIEAGELVGYLIDSHEFIHQKGSPGWRNSDTEMFPIIGPTDQENFRVQTPKGSAIQDQHGLLRELEYEIDEQTEVRAIFVKRYKADTLVLNSKFPKKSTEEKLSWPYDFEFTKIIELTNEGLRISFVIAGEKDMPFMLGYHPAFKLISDNTTIQANDKQISIEAILAVGSRALHVPNCQKIVLSDSQSMEISTTGFSDFMLWTEVSNMVCIEPITFYPYAVAQKNLHKGFTSLDNGKKEFTVFLKPLRN
jgi:galactose mutarotase-like enzyme